MEEQLPQKSVGCLLVDYDQQSTDSQLTTSPLLAKK